MAGSGTAHLRDPDASHLRAEHLVVEFPVGRSGRRVHAVSDLSIDILRGETVGLVGESGCGKSSTGRAILQLPPPTSGRVVLNGRELTGLRERDLREVRKQMQVILQDPISSINPRREVPEVVAEPLAIWGAPRSERATRVDATLTSVGIDPVAARGRRRSQFSGGQCQRICIGRALVNEPELVICDEPVSALDVSVQAQILNLLEEMKAQHSLTLLFITHDLGVVKHISDRLVVMYLGKICEVGSPEEVYRAPLHPYTQALLAAVPEPDPRATPRDSMIVEGDLPSPIDPPTGCRFRTRCPRADDLCASEEPAIAELRPGQFAACHHPLEEPASSTDVSVRPKC